MMRESTLVHPSRDGPKLVGLETATGILRCCEPGVLVAEQSMFARVKGELVLKVVCLSKVVQRLLLTPKDADDWICHELC